MLSAERAIREKQAYDEGKVWETNDLWHRRFPHVFECVNSKRAESNFRGLVADRVSGSRVLEIGCGHGEIAKGLLALNPESYLGIDVSDDAISRASQCGDSRARFKVHDVHQPIDGVFDVVFGQSVLHHIDFKNVLIRLYEQHLAPGGLLAFVEPLRGGLLFRAYWKFATNAHTPDERPLSSQDLRWFRQQFPGFRCEPFNYVSLTAGVVSSKIFRSADNPIMALADKFDLGLCQLGGFDSIFRRAVLSVVKPGG